MIVFRYDKTFDGLLSAVFDAYNRKSFPSKLLSESEIAPLFVNETHNVVTQKENSTRVWNALQKKLSKSSIGIIIHVWLSELASSDELIFKYICKVFDNKESIETNFADDDVLKMTDIAKKVSKERLAVIQFVRFQKAADGIFFAPISPNHNVLPLTTDHFKDRFADQKWVVYDMKRKYGYYYDLQSVSEISLNEDNFLDGKLNQETMDENEKLFQELWRNYYKSICIKERINPKLHRQHMPQRFWKYMPEKQ